MESPRNNKRPRTEMSGAGGGNSNDRNLKTGPCFMKLLVPDVIAGALIGKGGSTLTNLQQTTGSVIRLSAGGVYFPGTNERLVVASGSQEAINMIMYEVMVRVRDSISNNNMNGEFDDLNMSVKMVLPNSAISIVIGKGGEAVRALIAKTGAKVTASQRQDGMQERIVTMMGNFDQVKEAADNVVFRVQTDHENLRNMISNGLTSNSMHNQGPSQNFANSTASPAMGGQSHRSNGGMNAFNHGSPYGIDRAVAIQQVTIEFLVLNSLIGGVIGKGGCLLKDISQRAGAKIKIADKNDSEDDSRRFFVSGPLDSVHMAHSLIVQRVMQVHMDQQQATLAANSSAVLGANNIAATVGIQGAPVSQMGGMLSDI